MFWLIKKSCVCCAMLLLSICLFANTISLFACGSAWLWWLLLFWMQLERNPDLWLMFWCLEAFDLDLKLPTCVPAVTEIVVLVGDFCAQVLVIAHFHAMSQKGHCLRE